VDVTLTPAGHALVERTAAHVLAADEALLAGIDDVTLARLEALLTTWGQRLPTAGTGAGAGADAGAGARPGAAG
jgi:hypothetical protein